MSKTVIAQMKEQIVKEAKNMSFVELVEVGLLERKSYSKDGIDTINNFKLGRSLPTSKTQIKDMILTTAKSKTRETADYNLNEKTIDDKRIALEIKRMVKHFSAIDNIDGKLKFDYDLVKFRRENAKKYGADTPVIARSLKEYVDKRKAGINKKFKNQIAQYIKNATDLKIDKNLIKEVRSVRKEINQVFEDMKDKKISAKTYENEIARLSKEMTKALQDLRDQAMLMGEHAIGSLPDGEILVIRL